MTQHERTKRFCLAADELLNQLLVGFAHGQYRIDDTGILFSPRISDHS
jgi:hypothetical protein